MIFKTLKWRLAGIVPLIIASASFAMEREELPETRKTRETRSERVHTLSRATQYTKPEPVKPEPVYGQVVLPGALRSSPSPVYDPVVLPPLSPAAAASAYAQEESENPERVGTVYTPGIRQKPIVRGTEYVPRIPERPRSTRYTKNIVRHQPEPVIPAGTQYTKNIARNPVKPLSPATAQATITHAHGAIVPVTHYENSFTEAKTLKEAEEESSKTTETEKPSALKQWGKEWYMWNVVRYTDPQRVREHFREQIKAQIKQ